MKPHFYWLEGKREWLYLGKGSPSGYVPFLLPEREFLCFPIGHCQEFWNANVAVNVWFFVATMILKVHLGFSGLLWDSFLAILYS